MKTIFPDYEFQNVTKIPESLLSDKDLIIFDIDNTLVYPETIEVRTDIQEWFKRINKKYKCVCFSNSLTIKKRQKDIESKLGCELFISKNKKPSKRLFEKIVKNYNANPKKIVVIGDFMLTDVLFGNRNGATTILVKPFSSLESRKIKFFRVFENFLFKIIKKLKSFFYS